MKPRSFISQKCSLYYQQYFGNNVSDRATTIQDSQIWKDKNNHKGQKPIKWRAEK